MKKQENTICYEESGKYSQIAKKLKLLNFPDLINRKSFVITFNDPWYCTINGTQLRVTSEPKLNEKGNYVYNVKLL